jgi:hypothetical protein
VAEIKQRQILIYNDTKLVHLISRQLYLRTNRNHVERERGGGHCERKQTIKIRFLHNSALRRELSHKVVPHRYKCDNRILSVVTKRPCQTSCNGWDTRDELRPLRIVTQDGCIPSTRIEPQNTRDINPKEQVFKSKRHVHLYSWLHCSTTQ